MMILALADARYKQAKKKYNFPKTILFDQSV
jgi:hypothetical protein